MIKFLDGASATKELKKQIGASKKVRIAVAFWGENAAQELGLILKGKAATVICNLKSGGTNPRGIRPMIDAGVHVRQFDKLHGKMYLFDDCVIIGSSNASANGLSLQGSEISGWHEANLITDDKTVYSDAEAWFNAIHQDVIEGADLDAAEDAWSRRRRATPIANPEDKSLIEALRSNAATFSDRRIYICVCLLPFTEAGQEAFNRGRAEVPESQRHRIDGYEDWSQLPDGADLIRFSIGPRNGVEFVGFANTDDAWEIPYKNVKIKFFHVTNELRGIRRIRSTKEWKAPILQFTEDSCRDDGGFIELGEFARKYLVP
jgi:hypothetical protein